MRRVEKDENGCNIQTEEVAVTYTPDNGWVEVPPTSGPTKAPIDLLTSEPTGSPSNEPTIYDTVGVEGEVFVETRSPSWAPTAGPVPEHPEYTVQGDIELAGLTYDEASTSAVASIATALEVDEGSVTVVEIIPASEDRRRRMDLDYDDAWDILMNGNEKKRRRLEDNEEWNIVWEAVAESEAARDALIKVVEQPTFKNKVANVYKQVTGKSIGVKVVSVSRFRYSNRVEKESAPSSCYINIGDKCECASICGTDSISFQFNENEAMNCCCFYNR